MITGENQVLLDARAKVLQTRGFLTTTALGLLELDAALAAAAPALIIICTSYNLHFRLMANRMVAARQPEVPMLTLLRVGESGDDLVGESLIVTAGPVAVIEAAHRLTRNQ